MKTYIVRITRRGSPTVRITGIYLCAIDAINSGLDIAAASSDEPCGIHVEEVRP